MSKNKYLKQCILFYFVFLVVLFAAGLYVTDQSGIAISTLLQAAISAVVATTLLVSMLLVDLLFVLFVSGFSGVSIIRIYQYMNKTGTGTSRMLSFLTIKGRSEFRNLVERDEKLY